jgi:hypothetical protein
LYPGGRSGRITQHGQVPLRVLQGFLGGAVQDGGLQGWQDLGQARTGESGEGCRDRTLVADQCGCGREQAGAVGHYRVPGRDQVCFGQVSQRDRAILQCQHPIAVDAAVREPCVVQAHQAAPGALELVRPRLRSVARARPGLCVQLPLAQRCHQIGAVRRPEEPAHLPQRPLLGSSREPILVANHWEAAPASLILLCPPR